MLLPDFLAFEIKTRDGPGDERRETGRDRRRRRRAGTRPVPCVVSTALVIPVERCSHAKTNDSAGLLVVAVDGVFSPTASLRAIFAVSPSHLRRLPEMSPANGHKARDATICSASSQPAVVNKRRCRRRRGRQAENRQGNRVWWTGG